MCVLLGHEPKDPKDIVNFLRKIDAKKLIETQEQLLTKEALKLKFYSNINFISLYIFHFICLLLTG